MRCVVSGDVQGGLDFDRLIPEDAWDELVPADYVTFTLKRRLSREMDSLRCQLEEDAMKKRIVKRAIVLVVVFSVSGVRAEEETASSTDGSVVGKRTVNPVKLSSEHLEAVKRQRRIIVNNDVGHPRDQFGADPDEWVASRFGLFDESGSQVDSVSWCTDEGNAVIYPSKVLPIIDEPGVKKWLDDGVDILQVIVEASQERKLEAFFEYRPNGFDRAGKNWSTPISLPIKDRNPEWMLTGDAWWVAEQRLNFAIPGVQDYKLAILREVAENYDFDGMNLDFGRAPPMLPIGQQWEYRDTMTEFVRKVRLMLQEAAQRRGRPFLLSVRVAATVPGCHFDGLDIETWVQENLVDIIVMGVRSFEWDVAGFHRITRGTHVKLYPSIDDVHASDGYKHPPIEVLRGVMANAWHQGSDGVLVFNWSASKLSTAIGVKKPFAPHQQAYHEIGDPQTMRFKDKTFVVQRRFGGGQGERWDYYQNSNVQALLPAVLSGDDVPTILTVYVADDLPANHDRLNRIDLRLLLSGAPVQDVIQVKLNGILLSEPTRGGGGWWIYSLTPRHFALGPNLVSVRVPGAPEAITIEKLEVQVDYQD